MAGYPSPARCRVSRDLGFEDIMKAAYPPGYIDAMVEAKKKYPDYVQFYRTDDGNFLPWDLRPETLRENIQEEWNW